MKKAKEEELVSDPFKEIDHEIIADMDNEDEEIMLFRCSRNRYDDILSNSFQYIQFMNFLNHYFVMMPREGRFFDLYPSSRLRLKNLEV
jgi:hypothetical protein